MVDSLYDIESLQRFAIQLGTNFWILGNREQRNRQQGTGNREQATGNRQQGTGNRENNPVYLIVMQTALNSELLRTGAGLGLQNICTMYH